MLFVGPKQGVMLYFNGLITSDPMENAVQGKDFVDIPYVEVEGRILTIRVLEDPEYTVATADGDGNILR